MRKPSAKHEARVGSGQEWLYGTTKHKCKAVKRMEGALGIVQVRKTQGAGEVGKWVGLDQVKSKRVGVGHKGPCKLQD